jgi:hypothetical protein
MQNPRHLLRVGGREYHVIHQAVLTCRPRIGISNESGSVIENRNREMATLTRLTRTYVLMTTHDQFPLLVVLVPL